MSGCWTSLQRWNGCGTTSRPLAEIQATSQSLAQSGGGGKVSTLMAMPSAKGLFHRAVVESASAIRGVPTDEATKSAEAYLARLGVKSNQIDEVQKMPAEQLVAAMGSGGAAGPSGLRLAPVVDGHSLPRNPFDPDAPEISATVPLLIGSVETEVTFMRGTALDPMDDDALRMHVKTSSARR